LGDTAGAVKSVLKLEGHKVSMSWTLFLSNSPEEPGIISELADRVEDISALKNGKKIKKILRLKNFGRFYE